MFDYKLSICITTYNRPVLTSRLIDMLPVHDDVEYIVSDDGSDVACFANISTNYQRRKEQGLNISLIRHEVNSGKFYAYKAALESARGMYFMDIGSDDNYFEHNLLNVLECLSLLDLSHYDHLVGICGLCELRDGLIIGDYFGVDLEESSYIKMRYKDRISGDKVEVFRTDLLRKLEVPYFDEIYTPTSVYYLLSGHQRILLVNKPFANVNLDSEDRITKNAFKYILNSPNSMSYYYSVLVQQVYKQSGFYSLATAYLQNLRFAMLAGNIKNVKSPFNLFISFIAFPIASLLYFRDRIRLYRLRSDNDGIA